MLMIMMIMMMMIAMMMIMTMLMMIHSETDDYDGDQVLDDMSYNDETSFLSCPAEYLLTET